MQQVGAAPIAIHALYYLSMEFGMFEFEADEYTEPTGATDVLVTVKRISGNGTATVLIQDWPGTGLPGEHYKPISQRLVFGASEHVQYIKLGLLKKSHSKDLRFELRLSDPVNATVGFKYRTEVVLLSSKGLSTGAIVGISVGAGAVIGVAIVASVFCLRRGRSEVGLETISTKPLVY
jgi:hypothetical protein